MTTFAALAREARDIALAIHGVAVVIDPDGAATPALAVLAAASITAPGFGAATLAQPGRVMRFAAEAAPPRGALIAILDAPGGAEIERRRVQGDPVAVDARGLTVEIDTAPL